MKNINKHGSTKGRYALIALLAVFFLFLISIFAYQSLTEKPQVSECEQLMPADSPLMLPNERGEANLPAEELDFQQKERIAYGKYGFRKELKVEKTTIVSQEVSEDSALKDVYFGIYHDSNLVDPVAEISMGKVLKNAHASEVGEPEPYPDVLPFIDAVLEPGAYYLAVYSIRSQEDCIAIYESRQAAVATELELTEDQWGLFFSTGPEQKTYFKINVPAAGNIYVDRDFWRVTYDIQLCDADKKPIKTATLEPPGKEQGHQKAKLSIPASGVYYLQVSYDAPPSAYANEIRYTFNASQ